MRILIRDPLDIFSTGAFLYTDLHLDSKWITFWFVLLWHPYCSVHQQHLEGTWPMNTLNAIQFNIGGGGRAGDEDDRSALMDWRVETLHRFGNQCDHLVGEYHAEVVVRYQGDSAPSLGWIAAQGDASRLGNSNGASSEYAATNIKCGQREIGIHDDVHTVGKPRIRCAGSDDQIPHLTSSTGLRRCFAYGIRSHTSNCRSVVLDSLHEQTQRLRRRGGAGAPVGACDRHVVRRFAWWHVFQCGADVPKNLIPSAHCPSIATTHGMFPVPPAVHRASRSSRTVLPAASGWSRPGPVVSVLVERTLVLVRIGEG